MRRVFSDENRVQRYLDVEAALARVEARLGIIPAEAASEIARQAQSSNLDLERLGSRAVANAVTLPAQLRHPRVRVRPVGSSPWGGRWGLPSSTRVNFIAVI